MGTRHLICIFYKGQFIVIQYGQWDGYLDGQGKEILHFIQVEENLQRLTAGLAHIYSPTSEDIKAINAELDADKEKNNSSTTARFSVFDTPLNRLYPSLSRDTGAKILEVIAKASPEKRVPIQKDTDFIGDGSCEWVYVVDLDQRVFEVYEGNVDKASQPGNRFMDFVKTGKYIPNLVNSFSLNALPATDEEFYAAMETE
ncbi:hypothetical protein FQN57_001414 [Myotisia sp. PD_48]|nr:hypothetical protein FQN57_001414 [Myotisia sp. PD_48]